MLAMNILHLQPIHRCSNAQTNYFRGPHPAGNVSVQIQRIDPINKGEIVWVIYPQDVIAIGRLFNKGSL